MAYLKILTRRYNLAGCTDYAVNEDKTVENAARYALNPEKTEERFYASCLNCGSIETANEEMQKTKKRFGKEDKVLCYHVIQSFPPGEGTPEQIHKIGITFAKECFGDFEVVIGTHLDRGHLHNHIVINSVSFVDGRKYRSVPKTLYQLREISDRICKENGLSVIIPKGKGKHYAEWQAEKNGKSTIRSTIRKDVDAAIEKSFNYRSFLDAMRVSGYIVKYGENVKHTAVKPKGGQRYIRLSSLGQGYTEADIQERLQKKRLYDDFHFGGKERKNYNKIRLKGSFQKSRRIKGIRALYWKYLYLLGKAKKKTGRRKVSPYLYDDVIRFEKYVKQNKFLSENRIDTIEDIESLMSFFHGEISRLVEERKRIGKEVRLRGENIKVDAVYQQCSEQIKAYRAKLRMCENILETEGRIRINLQTMKELERKEGKEYEPGKRSGRTNDKGNPANQRNHSETVGNRG